MREALELRAPHLCYAGLNRRDHIVQSRDVPKCRLIPDVY